MKVISIVLLVAVAAVYSLPVEENVDSVAPVEVYVAESVDEINDGLVRDKRQFGGEKNWKIIVENWRQRSGVRIEQIDGDFV